MGSSRERGADERPRYTVAAAVSDFGRAVARKLQRGGQKEDQLRGPTEILLTRLGEHFGLDVLAYGEVALRSIRARPDYAVNIGDSRVGYLEIKAHDKGIPPAWQPLPDDERQWEKLKSLPNLIYTNGSQWAHFSYGVSTGPVALLDGDITWAGMNLRPANDEFEKLLRRFLTWTPGAPRSLQELIKVTAGLCRLLREEVGTILDHEKLSTPRRFTRLAEDWRNLLFPKLSWNDFADAYAQTVTFAMLLARASGVPVGNQTLRTIADQLGKHHPLMGRALDVLTNPEEARELSVIETLRQVIGPVDWDQLKGATSEHWVIYETFLQEYDPALRQKSGSYYTPDSVARFIVEFVDTVIKNRLDRSRGYAADDVVVVDPGMGTGTFLVEVVRSAAQTIADEQGEHSLPAHLRDLYRRRLVGFERQAAPYAVADLRLRRILKELYATEVPDECVRFLTDTFDDPDVQALPYGQMYEELEDARKGANRIKRDTPVLVVLGNPTYLNRARQRDPARWIEEPRAKGRPADMSRPSIDDFKLPGMGGQEFHLSSLYVYFWRWATWKVFDAHRDQPRGIVAFITPSSYLTGRGFAGMRRYLRETADEGWVIDLSPEGHRSDAETRIFTGVQQPICIGIFVRYGSADPGTPALVHHRSVCGSRKNKFDSLTMENISPDSQGWTTCSNGWIDEFTPITTTWASYPRLGDLIPWQRSGVKPNRTWVYAPDEDTLRNRWARLIAAPKEQKNQLLKATKKCRVSERLPRSDPRIPSASVPLRDESSTAVRIEPTAYCSFDRQYLIFDLRVIDRIRPELWGVAGSSQIFATEQHVHPIDEGPGLTFTSLVPDQHHFNKRGGRVLPLYRDGRDNPNVAPNLLRHISSLLNTWVTPGDLFPT